MSKEPSVRRLQKLPPEYERLAARYRAAAQRLPPVRQAGHPIYDEQGRLEGAVRTVPATRSEPAKPSASRRKSPDRG